jgi:hypothetical protein
MAGVPNTNTPGVVSYRIEYVKSFTFTPPYSQTTGLVDGVEYYFLDKENQYYCRLGNFLDFIEKHVMYQVGTNGVNVPLLNFDTDVESNLMYVNPMQISVDPTICMVNKDLTIRSKLYHFFPYGEVFLNPNIQSSTNAEYGQIMNIYVNFKFILDKLDENKDAETGAVALIDFLQSMLSGINGALGGLNKLDIFIDEVTNTVKIIDKNPLPDSEHVINYLNGKGTYKLYDEYATFNLYGYEKKEGENTKAGFIKDFSFKTEITPQMATMISVAAAANNTTVGENTTALSRLNSGLVDRFKESMSTTESTLQTDIVKRYQDIYDQMSKQYIGVYSPFMTYLIRIAEDKWTLDEASTYKDSLVNTLKYKQQFSKAWDALDASKKGKTQDEIDKILSAADESMNPSTGFIPFNLSLTMDGLSGMKVNSKFYIDSSYLPSNYPNTVEFLIKNEAHRIEGNKWFTTLESYCISKGNFKEISAKDIDPQGQKQSISTSSTQSNGTCIEPYTDKNLNKGWIGKKVPFVRTIVDPKIEGPKLSAKYGEVLTQAILATIQIEQNYKGFNWNLGGFDITSGGWEFDPKYHNGYVVAREGGTNKCKAFVSFISFETFIEQKVKSFISKGFNQATSADVYAKLWYEKWNGFGARTVNPKNLTIAQLDANALALARGAWYKNKNYV